MLEHADEEKMIDSPLKAQRTQRIHGGNLLCVSAFLRESSYGRKSSLLRARPVSVVK
ncbi:MAG: hypothetical protein [Olavius algarvensis Gamma 1 endosymbiont]|nr:MAG: hypothetical protein [Olavius algarvensis Gamma 1 endosymbiont]